MSKIPGKFLTTEWLRNVIAEEFYAGPAQLPTLGQTPSSQRVKRGKGLPEADTIPEGSDIRIEDDRVGGPLLASLPVSTGGLSAASPLALAWTKNRLARDVRHIVENHRIEWHGISAVTRLCARTADPRLRQFLLWQRNKTNEKWLRALKAISGLCMSVGILDVNVDIADWRGLLPILSFAVGPQRLGYSRIDDTVVESRWKRRSHKRHHLRAYASTRA